MTTHTDHRSQERDPLCPDCTKPKLPTPTHEQYKSSGRLLYLYDKDTLQAYGNAMAAWAREQAIKCIQEADEWLPVEDLIERVRNLK